MKKIYLFLSSLQLGISLLIIITLLSILGIIIPQQGSEEFYSLKFGEPLSSLILFCGFNNIFSTLWYKILLLLFSVNISLCTLNRIKKLFLIFTKAKNLTNISKEAIESFPVKFTFDTKEPLSNITNQIILFFKRRFFFISLQEKNENIILSVQNRWLKEVGSTIFHFGIIPLLVGGLINQLTGFSYLQMLKEGEIAKVKNSNLWVKCNKFEIERNKKGAIKDYRSSLILVDSAGNKLKEKVIEVNEPLVYQGIKFYQSSYKIEKDTSIRDIHLLISGEEFTEKGRTLILSNCGETLYVNKDIKIVVDRFVPDFCLNIETKEVFSRSYEHNNPAIFITIIKNNEKVFSGWQFKNINSFHHNPAQNYKISFLSYQTLNDQLITGILIKKAPGNIFIWFGILLMTFGILIVFGLPPSEVYIIALVKEDDKNKIIFTTPNKLEESELDRINKLKDKLERELTIPSKT